MKNFILSFLIALVIFAAGAAVAIYFQKPEAVIVDNTAKADSIQMVLDSVKQIKPKIVERVKWLHDTDTLIYIGTDTTCIEVIKRKDNLIVGLDSLVEVLGCEAELYSDLNVIEKERTALEIMRNKQLTIKMDSTIDLYKDSLNNVKERLYSGFFKRNHKWNRNEFRKYVMTK